MKTYFHTDYLTLTYDTEKRLGKAVWNGFLNSEEFRTASAACLELIENEQILYWLADNRKMKAIRQQDQEWFGQEIIPRLAQSPLRKMATLVSEDLLVSIIVKTMQFIAYCFSF